MECKGNVFSKHRVLRVSRYILFVRNRTSTEHIRITNSNGRLLPYFYIFNTTKIDEIFEIPHIRIKIYRKKIFDVVNVLTFNGDG